jgi:hypothetical protein
VAQLWFPAADIAAELMGEDDRNTCAVFLDPELHAVVGFDLCHPSFLAFPGLSPSSPSP